MYDNISIKDLYESFTNFEREHLLLENREFSYIWSSIRFEVFRQIQAELCMVQNAHDSGLSGKKSNIIKIGIQVFLEYCISKTQFIFWSHRSISYLFWGHSRRKLGEDGFYWDIYTDPLIEIIQSRETYLVCEDQYQAKYFKPVKTKYLYHPNYVFFELAIQKLFFRKHLDTSRTNTYFDKLEKGINSLFNIDIDIVGQAEYFYVTYYFKCRQFTKLLKRMNPRILFIVVSYGREHLIRAAKNLHIPVVELQHGVLSKYHLGYDFNSGQKDDFPDYFFSFGSAWGQMAHFTIPQERIIPIGYQYLNTEVRNLKEVEKKDQLLFLSQGTIGDRLSEFAVNLLKNLPDGVKIIYKLHPGEYLRWKSEYKALYYASEKGLITVIDGDRPSLYQLMAESKWQIGVNSTALFEGMAFKCKTYIVDLPGIEYVETLINRNEFILVQNPSQIEFTYNSEQLNYRTDEYFFQDTETRFRDAIDFVMRDYNS